MEKSLSTLREFEEEAARFVRTLAPQKKTATLVTLSGELGAGKTAFVKAAARALGVGEVVTSPTFVLEKIYLLPSDVKEGFARLIHIDAYRLECGADLSPLGFDELTQDRRNLILLEWPEKVADALLVPSDKIIITVNPGGLRVISYV